MAEVFYANGSELATLTNTFAVDGEPTDPDTVTLTVTSPSGDVATYTYADTELGRDSAGAYRRDVACTEPGAWVYMWVGTGAASDAVAGTWTVFSTQLGALYCTPEELKSRLGISDSVDDFEIRLAVEAVSRSIDDHCNRQFWRTTATRTFAATGAYGLDVDDLVSVDALSTDEAADGTYGTAWSSSDFQLWPVNAATYAEARPYTQIRALTRAFPTGGAVGARDDRVQIAGVFGWPAVPAAVKQACLVLAADCFKLKDAPFGMQAYGDFAVRVRDNPRAMALLGPYRRHPVLVG